MPTCTECINMPNFCDGTNNNKAPEICFTRKTDLSNSVKMPVCSKWIGVDNTLPTIGQTVILFANGIVQEETYKLDMDINEYGAKFFWCREGLEECFYVESEQKWMPLPTAPFKV